MSYHQVLIPLPDESKYIGEMYLIRDKDRTYTSRGKVVKDSIMPSLEHFQTHYNAEVEVVDSLPNNYTEV